MFFTVTTSYPIRLQSGPAVFLVEDNWDDWFTFETTYHLHYVDEDRNRTRIGSLKVGEFNMIEDQRRPALPRSFDQMPAKFFSLGQDDAYYLGLNELGAEIRDRILKGLNDVAADEAIFSRSLSESVTRRSLLRFITPTTVRGQFRRLANGGARLTPYEFSYRSPKDPEGSVPVAVTFKVQPESNPPTNIHVLIGRNGVGKTRMINNMIHSLLGKGTKHGKFIPIGVPSGERLFANLVSVTFSAFDEQEPLPERRDRTSEMHYSYIGLKRPKNVNGLKLGPKSPKMLASEFVRSVKACNNEVKSPIWKRALEKLEADPIFKENEVAKVSAWADKDENSPASETFKKLSSGHKIVLLTITRLVETIEERTLILIDEPEAHLHPPLLSAFVRALSDLVIHRNAVVIIATHSPVVLQEVPRSCVWSLRRSGGQVSAERLEIESFGENVDSLTREVFGLEVTHSGFHELLNQAIEKGDDIESIEESFNSELGQEARAIIAALHHLKNSKKESDETNL